MTMAIGAPPRHGGRQQQQLLNYVYTDVRPVTTPVITGLFIHS